MKKLVLTMLFGLIALAGYSQLRWDAQFGMNFSNMTKLDESKALPGFKLGIGMDYAFTDSWSFQSGLMFASKGFKVKEDGWKATQRPIYLDIPLLAAYKFNITNDIKFVIDAGPYLAIGLGGKYKDDDNDDGKVFDKEGSDWKRFDLGLQYGVGLELADRYLINLTGQNGFISPSDAVNEDGDKVSPKNMTFTIGVGYIF